jgi:hypothetical protein
MASYYYAQKGAESWEGPFNLQDMRQLIEDRIVLDETQVFREGQEEGRNAILFDELAVAIRGIRNAAHSDSKEEEERRQRLHYTLSVAGNVVDPYKEKWGVTKSEYILFCLLAIFFTPIGLIVAIAFPCLLP